MSVTHLFWAALLVLANQACEYNVTRDAQRTGNASLSSSSNATGDEQGSIASGCKVPDYNAKLFNDGITGVARKSSKYYYTLSSDMDITLKSSDTNAGLVIVNQHQYVTSNKISEADAAPYLAAFFLKREHKLSEISSPEPSKAAGLPDLKCAVGFVDQIKRIDDKQGVISHVTFSPAIPYFLTPEVAAGALAKLIPDTGVKTSEIVATVVSANPSTGLKSNSTFKGTVGIKKVVNNNETTFQISAIFGTPSQSLELGLFPNLTWQVREGQIKRLVLATEGILKLGDLVLRQTEAVYEQKSR